MSGDHLVIEPTVTAPVGVLRVAGMMFLPDVPRLLGEVTAALRTAPSRVVICDISRLDAPLSEYLLTVFPAALRRAGGWPHASLHLARPDPRTALQLRRLHIHRFLPVHATFPDALLQARADLTAEPFELRLEPTPETLLTARTALRSVWPAGAPRGREEAVLVVNELASNAIRHVAEPFTVSLAPSADEVLVAVTDGSRNEPVLRPPHSSSPSGRGIQIVAALSRDWGVRLVHRGGKTVWARLSADAPTPLVPRSRSALGH